MEIQIGTSGFQYAEWKGLFYPEDLSAAKMLPYYAERFSTTESNYTFRHTPSEKAIAKWRDTTPASFRFSFKAPQGITHFAKLRGCARKVAAFQKAIAPMGEKIGAVLFQLPPTLKADRPALRDFLKRLPAGMRAAFEFRHESWFAEPIIALLRDAGAALCIAETEEFATPQIATANFGYLRLRRLDYKPAALKRWAAWVGQQAEQWQETYVYFKHEETAAGPKFARTFAKLFVDVE